MLNVKASKRVLFGYCVGEKGYKMWKVQTLRIKIHHKYGCYFQGDSYRDEVKKPGGKRIRKGSYSVS